MYLDINRISELYKGKGDDAKGLSDKERYSLIAAEVMNCYEDSKNAMLEPAKKAQENTLMWAGEQYLEYDDTIHQYHPIDDNEYADFIPQPKDNLLAPIVNTMLSLLTQNKPTADVVDNSDNSQDKNRAKLSGAIQDAKWAIDKEQAKYRLAAKLGIITGTVYRKDYWNTSGLQTVRVNVQNDDGTMDTIEAPLGDNDVKILSIFEVIPDLVNSILDIDDGRYILEAQVLPIKDIKYKYGKKEKGFTGLGKEVQASEDKTIITSYIERLRGTYSNGVGTLPEMKDAAVVIEGYSRPTPEVPQGLKFVVCNNKLLYIKESPYTEPDGTNWHPYSMWRYDDHPLRHHGKALLDDLVPIQRRYNSILALQVLNRQTMAIPQWLIPNGALPVDGSISGEPGLNIFFDPVNGLAPMKQPGIGLDSSVYKEQEMAEQKIHRIAGDNEVMQGNRPTGVNTATMFNMMLEQATSVHSPKLQSWEDFIARSQSKKLNLIRREYQEPRQSLINRVKALNSDNREVEIDDLFTGQQLGNNVDVRIEAGSYLPRLKSAQRQNLMEAYQAGLLGDLSPDANPVGNKSFLEKLGLVQFATSTSETVKKAEWENDAIRQGKREDVKALPTENPVTHFNMILKEVYRPEFFDSNSDEVIALYNEHAMEHWRMMSPQQKMMVVQSEAQIMKIDESQNIYGLGLMQQPPPSVEERLNMLEGAVGQQGQVIDMASKFLNMGAAPGNQESMLSPQQGSPAGVASNDIPPIMA